LFNSDIKYARIPCTHIIAIFADMSKTRNNTNSTSDYAIAVLIPAYNEQDTLPMLLDSLKNQEINVPVSVIVANNNSTDNTIEICKEHGTNVVDCKIQGIGAARNAAIDYMLSNAPYDLNKTVAVQLDADCELGDNGYLKSVLQAFINNPNAMLGIGKTIYTVRGKNGERIIDNGYDFKQYFNTLKTEQLFNLLNRDATDYLLPSTSYKYFVGGNTTYRASLFKNKDIRFLDDKSWEMIILGVRFYQNYTNENVIRIENQVVRTSSRAYEGLPLEKVREKKYVPPFKSKNSLSPLKTLQKIIKVMDKKTYKLESNQYIEGIFHKESPSVQKLSKKKGFIGITPAIHPATKEVIPNKISVIFQFSK